MTALTNLKIEDYNYILPNDVIAKYPLEVRDESKLLIYNKTITDDIFRNIAHYLPDNALLINNNSKVIPARLTYIKPSGGIIEIFCLEPLHTSVEQGMQAKNTTEWKCYIGGVAKWSKATKVSWDLDAKNTTTALVATIVLKQHDYFVVEFRWATDIPFVEVLQSIGKIPIPPYLNRIAEAADTETYQTVYAQIDGSVAAPTAGLHFTKEVISSIEAKNILTASCTLHVGAGTFKPIKTTFVNQHEMHAEWVQINKTLIAGIILKLNKYPIICVGTTSIRSIESLYWWALQCFNENKLLTNNYIVPQWVPYQNTPLQKVTEVLEFVVNKMELLQVDAISFKTQIMIVPGYQFKICNILITNFHQPSSTLLLLISAFTNEKWNTIYTYALANNYRFLSYGDSSLLFNNNDINT